MAAASPTIAVSGWAMTLSQSCTTRESRPVHRMFWVSQSPWPIHTAGQLDSDDVGRVSGPEEHAVERHPQVTQTPVREEFVIEHTWQRIAASGNALS
jgi:hypothetical protein